MSRSYDPTPKTLVEGRRPTGCRSWVCRAIITVEDTDLATVVSGAVDKVCASTPSPSTCCISTSNPGHDSAILPRRLLLYNGVLDYRHDRLVLSVAVLLRPEADSPQLTGSFERAFPGQERSRASLSSDPGMANPRGATVGGRCRHTAVGADQRRGGIAGAGGHSPHEGCSEPRATTPAPGFVGGDLLAVRAALFGCVRGHAFSGGAGDGRIHDLPSDSPKGPPRRRAEIRVGPWTKRFVKGDEATSRTLNAIEDVPSVRGANQTVSSTRGAAGTRQSDGRARRRSGTHRARPDDQRVRVGAAMDGKAALARPPKACACPPAGRPATEEIPVDNTFY